MYAGFSPGFDGNARLLDNFSDLPHLPLITNRNQVQIILLLPFAMHSSLSSIATNQARAPRPTASIRVHEDENYSHDEKYDAFDDFCADSGGSGKKLGAVKASKLKGSNGKYSSKHVRVNSERRSKRCEEKSNSHAYS